MNLLIVKLLSIDLLLKQFVLLSFCMIVFPAFSAEPVENVDTTTLMWCNASGDVVRKETKMSSAKASKLFNLPKRKSNEVLLRCPKKNNPKKFNYLWSSDPENYLKANCCATKTKKSIKTTTKSKTLVASTLNSIESIRINEVFPQCKARLLSKRGEPSDLLRVSDELDANATIVIRVPSMGRDFPMSRKFKSSSWRLAIPLIPSISEKEKLEVLSLGESICRLGKMEYRPLKAAPGEIKKMLLLQAEYLRGLIELNGSSIAEMRAEPSKVPRSAALYALLYDRIMDTENPQSLYRAYEYLMKTDRAGVELLGSIIAKAKVTRKYQKLITKLPPISKVNSSNQSQTSQLWNPKNILNDLKQVKGAGSSMFLMSSPLFLVPGKKPRAKKPHKNSLACVKIKTPEKLDEMMEYQYVAAELSEGGRMGKRMMDDFGLYSALVAEVVPVVKIVDVSLQIAAITADLANSLLPKEIYNLKFKVRSTEFNEDHDVPEIYRDITIDAKSDVYSLTKIAITAFNLALNGPLPGGKYGTGAGIALGVTSNICGRYDNCGIDKIKGQPAIGPCIYKSIPLSYDYITANVQNEILVVDNKGKFKINKAGDGDLTLYTRSSRFSGRTAQSYKNISVKPIDIKISPLVAEVVENQSQKFNIKVKNAYDTSIKWEITSDYTTPIKGESAEIVFTPLKNVPEKCRVIYSLKVTSTSRRGIRSKGVPERSSTHVFQVRKKDASDETCNEIFVSSIPACLDKGKSHQFSVVGEGDAIAKHPVVKWSASVGAISSNGLYKAPNNYLSPSVTIRAETTSKPNKMFEIEVALGCTCMYAFSSSFGSLNGNKVGISSNLDTGGASIGTGGAFDFVSGEIIDTSGFFNATNKDNMKGKTSEEISAEVSKGFDNLIASMSSPKTIIPPLSIKLDPSFKKVDVFSFKAKNGTSYYMSGDPFVKLSGKNKKLVMGEISGRLADAKKERSGGFSFKFRAAKGSGALCSGLRN